MTIWLAERLYLTTPAQNSMSDSNGIQTHNHLVCQQTLNHLAKLSKWLSCVVSTYLYGTFDCILLSCHICVSEWICTLQLPECQRTPCLKQVQYLKFQRHHQNWEPTTHNKEFHDIQTTVECRFTLKHAFDMTITYRLIHHTDK